MDVRNRMRLRVDVWVKMRCFCTSVRGQLLKNKQGEKR
jgi:hypothetical protein